FEVLMRLAAEHEIHVRDDMGPGAVIEELYGELVEAKTVRPTFYRDFPVETSPLAGPHRSIPGLAERWDLVINGTEMGTAYSEMADALEQRRRLTEQSLKAAAGNPEAMQIDEDFLAALETGLPPTGGLGIGIDRLIMMLTDAPIRGVLAFPFVRPAPGARPAGRTAGAESVSSA
ncbi:lysine--tRNA ligase, partial [Amycolatopsis sp. H6(2020)]|nr:lysine--tRNA ligase [Amycolatopsis sp. H6(2020)]